MSEEFGQNGLMILMECDEINSALERKRIWRDRRQGVEDRTGCGGVVIIEGVSKLEFRSREMHKKKPVCGRKSPQRAFSECCILSPRPGSFSQI